MEISHLRTTLAELETAFVVKVARPLGCKIDRLLDFAINIYVMKKIAEKYPPDLQEKIYGQLHDERKLASFAIKVFAFNAVTTLLAANIAFLILGISRWNFSMAIAVITCTVARESLDQTIASQNNLEFGTFAKTIWKKITFNEAGDQFALTRYAIFKEHYNVNSFLEAMARKFAVEDEEIAKNKAAELKKAAQYTKIKVQG